MNGVEGTLCLRQIKHLQFLFPSSLLATLRLHFVMLAPKKRNPFIKNLLVFLFFLKEASWSETNAFPSETKEMRRFYTIRIPQG